MRLLGVEHAEQAALVGCHRLDVVEPVEALLGGGPDEVPWRLLRAVVVIGDRPHHVARENVALALPLDLFVTQTEIHGEPPGSLTD